MNLSILEFVFNLHPGGLKNRFKQETLSIMVIPINDFLGTCSY